MHDPVTCPSTEAGAARQSAFAVIFGFRSMVGAHLVRELVRRGFTGLCLGRAVTPTRELPPGFSWQPVPDSGRIRVPASATLFSLVPGPALPALLTRIAGGDRLIALSSTGAAYKSASADPDERAFARELIRAEDEIRSLCRTRGMAWTILRPTMVYDPGHDRNVSVIASFIRRFGAVPVIRPGTGRRQPVHAGDVAAAMMAAADAEGARDRRFDLPGGETVAWDEMVRRIFAGMGRRPILIYLPRGPARLAFRFYRRLGGARYSMDSLERMNMDLTFDPAPARRALGIACRTFHPEFPRRPE